MISRLQSIEQNLRLSMKFKSSTLDGRDGYTVSIRDNCGGDIDVIGFVYRDTFMDWHSRAGKLMMPILKPNGKASQYYKSRIDAATAILRRYIQNKYGEDVCTAGCEKGNFNPRQL